MRKLVTKYLELSIKREIDKIVRQNVTEKLLSIDNDIVKLCPEYLYKMVSNKPFYRLLGIKESDFNAVLDQNSDWSFTDYTLIQLFK